MIIIVIALIVIITIIFNHDMYLLREADCRHRALVHYNAESRKLRIRLHFGKLIYTKLFVFHKFNGSRYGRSHGNKKSNLKISISRRVCKIPSLKVH